MSLPGQQVRSGDPVQVVPPLGLDAGSWADWVGGVATFLAVCVALWQSYVARRAVEDEQRERQSRQELDAEDRRRMQAAALSAWIEDDESPPSEHSEEEAPGAFWAYLRNSSGAVMYEVMITLVNGWSERESDHVVPLHFCRILRAVPPGVVRVRMPGTVDVAGGGCLGFARS